MKKYIMIVTAITAVALLMAPPAMAQKTPLTKGSALTATIEYELVDVTIDDFVSNYKDWKAEREACGCLKEEILKKDDDARKVIVIATWKSKEAYEKCMAGDKETKRKPMTGIKAEPEVTWYHTTEGP